MVRLIAVAENDEDDLTNRETSQLLQLAGMVIGPATTVIEFCDVDEDSPTRIPQRVCDDNSLDRR
jgi:hypothetical protein